MDERITMLIEDVCEELNIAVPIVSFDVSVFLTDTTMAMADVKTNTIHIRERKIDADYIFAIIHELRHLWQWKTDKRTYFDNYKNSSELSLEEYNLQSAEVDANAYAGKFMIENFKVKPLWNGMSNRVVAEIEKRMTEIKF